MRCPSVLAMALISVLCISACNSAEKQQQPTPEEQKRIQEANQKAIEQQKQLTSGYGNSMNHDAPNTEFTPDNKKKQKAQKAKAQPPTQDQQQQKKNQPQK